MAMDGSACHGVRVVSRRMVRPSTSEPGEETRTKPPNTTESETCRCSLSTTSRWASSCLSHLRRQRRSNSTRWWTISRGPWRAPWHGSTPSRAAVDEKGEGVTVSLLNTGDGAELVHAVAEGTTVSNVAGSPRIPRVVWSFFPLNGLLGADAAGCVSVPVLAAQVTELADGVFVAMSLNHGVADGTAFWHLFNTWAEISRGQDEERTSTAAPVLERWFPDACSVQVPLPFPTLDHAVRRFRGPPVEECFFDFSAESVRNLKVRAIAEIIMAARANNNAEKKEIFISSLQSLLAHLWLAVTRARCLPPEQETTYTLAVGCRARVRRLPQA